MLQEENKTNIPYSNDYELSELKNLLLNQVIQSKKIITFCTQITFVTGRKLNDILRNRCSRLKEIINIFDTQIEYEDKLILKHRNVEQLNILIKELSDTLMTTTETELNLGVKTRDLEYSQHEFKMMQNHFDSLKKKYDVLKLDLKTAKETIKDFQWKQKHDLKELVSTKKIKEQMENKVNGLTEGLNFIQENSESLDYQNKLKNTIFILIRENKQLKNQLCLTGLSDQSP